MKPANRHSQSGTPPEKWVPFRKAQANPRLILVCFSHSGGSASIYRKWTEVISSDIEIWGIQTPGRENRLKEPLEHNLSSLIRQMGDELGPVFQELSLPFVFFGHSLGGLIAFEFARDLRRRGCRGPRRLIASCTHSPQFPDDTPSIHGYPDEQFLEELRKYGGTPPEFFQHSDLLKLYLPILRADFALSETYTYQKEPLLLCPISVYGALSDTNLKTEGLSAWKEETRSSFQLRMFEGNHFYLHPGSVAFFRALIWDCLTSEVESMEKAS